jgi:HD domain
VITADEAAGLAEQMLAETLPRRWRHVRSVARRARWVAKQLSLPDDLVAAAWLHDIGYAPELVERGFHPLDGARFLRRQGVDEQVVSLVAYHSCAQIEADVRGLRSELAAEFVPGDSSLTGALLYCDITTGPDGDYVRPTDRLVEIRGRYGPDHEVTRFVERAASEILATAGRVEGMLAAQPISEQARHQMTSDHNTASSKPRTEESDA